MLCTSAKGRPNGGGCLLPLRARPIHLTSATRSGRWWPPYLTLMKEAAPQREYPMREMFNALRYVIRYGIAWRAMPNDFPP